MINKRKKNVLLDFWCLAAPGLEINVLVLQGQISHLFSLLYTSQTVGVAKTTGVHDTNNTSCTSKNQLGKVQIPVHESKILSIINIAHTEPNQRLRLSLYVIILWTT